MQTNTIKIRRNTRLRIPKRKAARIIAEVCGVHNETVGRLPPMVTDSVTITERIGKDGVRQPATKPRKEQVPPHPDDLAQEEAFCCQSAAKKTGF